MKTKQKKQTQESDTDSVASSSASFQFNLEKRQPKGVSPLNRRRSLRIAQAAKRLQLDRDSTMRDVSALKFASSNVGSMRSQQTVQMESPTAFEHLGNSTKWNHWRKQSTLVKQGTVTKSVLKKGKSIPKKPAHKLLQWRGPKETLEEKRSPELPCADEESCSLVPSLLKKQTTTTGLRFALERTKIESVGACGTDAIPGTSSGTKTRLKRKATALRSPTSEEPLAKKAGMEGVKYIYFL